MGILEGVEENGGGLGFRDIIPATQNQIENTLDTEVDKDTSDFSAESN